MRLDGFSSNAAGGFPALRSRTRLPRLRPRHVVSKPGQTHEPEGLVEVREWIAPALASPALVLEAQPPTQPHSRIVVERVIRLAGGADAEVIGPPRGARGSTCLRAEALPGIVFRVRDAPK
jgi:hypothetical protein